MKKIYGSAAEALDGLLFDGMFIAAGGFGLCGIPKSSTPALLEAKVRSLVPASLIASSS
ncbi:MAG: CoA-transferase, partial [Pseudomonadota bacterium]